MTAHPSAEWIARQLTEACGWSQPPRYIIRDRDIRSGNHKRAGHFFLSVSKGSLSAFDRGGPSSTSSVAGPASVTDASSGKARAPIFALACHRASKVPGSVGAHACEFGAHACESSRLRGFSGTMLVTASPEAGRADVSLGHSNNDLEIPGLPSYQHFRPSIIR